MKKVLSWILVFVMLFTSGMVSPIAVYADTADSGWVESVDEDEYVDDEEPVYDEEYIAEQEPMAQTMTVDVPVTYSYGDSEMNGKVHDDTGMGLADVAVEIYDITDQRTIGVFYTDEYGYWEADEITSGNNYTVRYYHPRYQIDDNNVRVTAKYGFNQLANVLAKKLYDEFVETDSSKFTYSEINGLYIKITKYTGSDAQVVIPAEIDGYMVQSVDGSVFKNNTTLETVVFSKHMTSIGSYCFYGCTNLKNVIFNAEFETIGSYAFYGCTGLRSISLPDGLKTIGSYAFSGCTAFTEVELPDSVSSMGCDVFAGCSNLESINFPMSWSEVSSSIGCIFENCTKLTKITVPEGVTKIPNSAFRGANKLREISLPSTLKTIGSYAFYGCVGLTTVNVPDNVTTIGSYAFYGCTGLRSISLPDGLKTIGSYAFSGCTAFTEHIKDDRQLCVLRVCRLDDSECACQCYNNR